VGSQKIEGCFIKILLSYLAFGHTWLNFLWIIATLGTSQNWKKKTGGLCHVANPKANSVQPKSKKLLANVPPPPPSPPGNPIHAG
jgi:hypothetical protein